MLDQTPEQAYLIYIFPGPLIFKLVLLFYFLMDFHDVNTVFFVLDSNLCICNQIKKNSEYF